MVADFAQCTSPAAWAASLGGPQVPFAATIGRDGATLRRWRDIDPNISQPAFDQHYLTIHLGGRKRIVRRGEGRAREVDTEDGAMSLIPAGAAYEWRTSGPVDFAHLYLPVSAVRQIGIEAFGRDGGWGIEDRLGFVDPLIRSLFVTMLAELATPDPTSDLYLDTLYTTLMAALLKDRAGRLSATGAPLSLTPARLRRVYDYIDVNFASDIGIDELAGVAALSRFHFSRAFTAANGAAPYAYLTAQRIAHSKVLLGDASLVIGEIARQSGFRTPGQFCRMFKNANGISPREYRRLAR
ncbi:MULTISPECIES: AraC family transcriptional regulator [Sphingosinicellaceae]|uniref:AraC family transcriptional regulator n=1 Tax=Sphingosinicellaceae TaxID=2820280 RepID=UPI001C1E4667|nr:MULTISPECIES: AraC family transcriptional regulator [Polymorphobacter]QYE35677.1 AraC family transcriptional regulator [Polymorphobacter sp. PAMC 29334]UAJ10955.1 AraC family transcriptional regulator [Polymorphobacter megasporae]